MAGSSNILWLTYFLILEMRDTLKKNDTRHPAYDIHHSYTFDPAYIYPACEIPSQRASDTKGFSIHIANLLCVIP